METGCYEILIDGLTFAGKVWAKGEIVEAKQVPLHVQSIWNEPKRQRVSYGRFVVRPRPLGYAGEVAEVVMAPLGVTENVGHGLPRLTKIGPNPPPLGPGGEVGISGMRR